MYTVCIQSANRLEHANLCFMDCDSMKAFRYPKIQKRKEERNSLSDMQGCRIISEKMDSYHKNQPFCGGSLILRDDHIHEKIRIPMGGPNLGHLFQSLDDRPGDWKTSGCLGGLLGLDNSNNIAVKSDQRYQILSSAFFLRLWGFLLWK